MATVLVTLTTGGDDLRGGSWADLVVKLQGRDALTISRFTGTAGLPADGDPAKFPAEVPGLTAPDQVEMFQILHVSQEGFGQTADNWDLKAARFEAKFGRFEVKLAEHGFHRFTGRSRLLSVFPPQA